MRRKVLGLLAGVLSVLCLAAAPAAAAPGQSAPPGCDAYRFDIFAGEGIAVTCGYPVDPPYVYRVIAHCEAAGSYWFRPGDWVEAGFGPSVAECHGGLLSSASVVGYHVEGI